MKLQKSVVTVAGTALALSISFTALVGCNQSNNGNDSTTPPSILSTDENGSTYVIPGTEDPSGSTTTGPIDFVTVDETVYVIVDTVNLREGPSTEAKFIDYATKGESMRRVRYSGSWSVVVYNGMEVYVSSDCVSTENPAKTELQFNPIDKTIYVSVEKANLRISPSAADTSTILYLVIGGDELTAIGISTDQKWYKVNYKEKICYISASCVVSEKPGAGFTPLEKTVYVIVDVLNVRKAPSAEEGSTIVGNLKKNDAVEVVGVNAAGTWYQVKFTVGGVEGLYYISASAKNVSNTKPAS